MKKIITLLILIFLTAGACFAFDLEKISQTAPTELDYPGASAVILKDYIQYEYYKDGSYTLTENEVVKILDLSAAGRFGEIEYVYNSNISDVIIEKANILTPDGKLVSISPKDFKEEKPLKKIEPFGFVSVKKIKFPRVSPGAIIEYSVKHINRKPESKGNFWGSSYFQDYEPIMESVLTVSVPAGKEIFSDIEGNGGIAATVKNEKNRDIYIWKSFNGMPAPNETASDGLFNTVPRARFSTFGTWDEVAKWYANLIQSSKSVTLNINEITEKVTSGCETRGEKIKAVHDYIVENYTFIDLPFNNIGFAPRKIDTIIRYKRGNASDLTALCVKMFNICNIPAYPVLAGTREYIKLNKEIADPSQFNYSLVAVPSDKGYTFVDVASKYSSLDNLPALLQGRVVLICEGGRASFDTIPVTAAAQNKEEITVEALIRKDGTIMEAVKIKEFGANAATLRNLFSQFNRIYKRAVFLLLSRSVAPEAMLIEVYAADEKKIDGPYDLLFIFEARDFIDTGEPLMYFTLPMFPLQNLVAAVSGDPRERLTPVLIGSTISTDKKINIILPQTFIPAGLPAPITLRNDVGQYEYTCKYENNTIKARAVLTINKIEVPKQEYKQLRDLIEASVNTERQLIVLKKKE